MHTSKNSTSQTGNNDWAADAVADLPPLATAKEVAAVLRTSHRTLQRYVAIGRLKAVRTDGGSARTLFPRQGVVDFLRGCEGA